MVKFASLVLFSLPVAFAHRIKEDHWHAKNVIAPQNVIAPPESSVIPCYKWFSNQTRSETGWHDGAGREWNDICDAPHGAVAPMWNGTDCTLADLETRCSPCSRRLYTHAPSASSLHACEDHIFYEMPEDCTPADIEVVCGPIPTTCADAMNAWVSWNSADTAPKDPTDFNIAYRNLLPSHAVDARRYLCGPRGLRFEIRQCSFEERQAMCQNCTGNCTGKHGHNRYRDNRGVEEQCWNSTAVALLPHLHCDQPFSAAMLPHPEPEASAPAPAPEGDNAKSTILCPLAAVVAFLQSWSAISH
jgi:hypothetical protein